MTFDVLIAGGGAAGLSAAVVLGRARRRVLVCDTGEPRNSHSPVHGFLTRDATSPGELRKQGLQEALAYGVEHRKVRVTRLMRSEDRFVASLEDGTTELSKRVLISTGLEDQIPSVPGSREIYGTSLWHCPYCHGWEARDRRLGVLGRDKKAFQEALSVKTWSDQVTLITDGRHSLMKDQLERLARNGVAIRSERVQKFTSSKGQLQTVLFHNGEEVALDGLFFVPKFHQRSDLAQGLGCHLSRKGLIVTNRRGQTSEPGVYAAGDSSHHLQLLAIAVGEGVRAAVSINVSLQAEERL